MVPFVDLQCVIVVFPGHTHLLFSCLLHALYTIVSKKAKIRNRYNQVPQLTKDTTWESDKNTRKHHIQESQEVSPSPAGDHKAAMNK